MDKIIGDVIENIVYGKSPLEGILFSQPDSHNDIYKRGCFDKQIKKLKIKYKRFNPSRIRKVKGKQYARPFYTSWITAISTNMSVIDLQLQEAIAYNEKAIFNALKIPKEYMGNNY